MKTGQIYTEYIMPLLLIVGMVIFLNDLLNPFKFAIFSIEFVDRDRRLKIQSRYCHVAIYN